MSVDGLIALSVFALDYPMPPIGWTAELGRRGIAIVEDDLGRPSIPRSVARDLMAEHRAAEARKAEHLAEVEAAAVAADRAFRASLPAGIPAGMVPAHLTAAEVMVAGDPMQRPRRKSVLETALEHPAGFVVYTPINEDAP
jgi:hypothetical protein